MKPILLLLTVCICAIGYGQPLVRFQEQGKTGFIDTSGNVVIGPRYENAGKFSQGYAPVRENGLYGYIDSKGNYVIPPTYDFAEPIDHGIASVYTNSKLSYVIIEKNKPVHKEASELKISHGHGLSWRRTKDDENAIYGANGKMILSGISRAWINEAHNVAVVQEDINVSNSQNRQLNIGMINSTGHFIIPYGRYNSIEHFENGYAVVHDVKNGFNGLIDTQGIVLFTIDDTIGHLSGVVSDGLLLCYLYKSKRKYDMYPAYIDTTGKIVIADTNYSGYEPFEQRRVFMRDRNGDYVLLNTKGERLNKQPYDRTYGYFENGIMLVELGDKQLLIDTNGNTIREFEFDDVNRYGIKDGRFIFEKYPEPGERHYGLCDIKGNIIIPPILDEDYIDNAENVLMGIADGRLTYFSQSGKMIWQSQPNTTPAKLNTDVMGKRGFYIRPYGQKHVTDPKNVDHERPKIITAKNNFPSNKLSLIIRTTDTTVLDNKLCYTVYIANNTNRNIKFNVQDGRAYMKMQAKDKDGNWKDIEYLRNSRCGNSYYRIKLESGLYWGLPVPIHEGRIKTKLRAKLHYINPEDHKKQAVIYSNEIDGEVNPAQLWRSDEYLPKELRDRFYE